MKNVLIFKDSIGFYCKYQFDEVNIFTKCSDNDFYFSYGVLCTIYCIFKKENLMVLMKFSMALILINFQEQFFNKMGKEPVPLKALKMKLKDFLEINLFQLGKMDLQLMEK